MLCTPPWPAPTTRPFPPAAAPPTDCRVGRQDPAHCGAGRERAGAEGLPAARVALCGGQEDQRAGAREAAPGAAGSPGSPAFGLLLQGASTPSQEAEGAVPDGCGGRALTTRAAGAHAASQPWPAPPLPAQLMNDIKALCHAPNVPGLIRFYGAYHAADRGQIAVVLEYMDGGSLADVLAKVRCAGQATGHGCALRMPQWEAWCGSGVHQEQILHPLVVGGCLGGAAATGAAWPHRPAGR